VSATVWACTSQDIEAIGAGGARQLERDTGSIRVAR
jgi:hypothetical protein